MNQYKIVLVGDAEIGKSALSFRISNNIFLSLYKPTIGAEYASIQVQGCRFNIWDTAGQETYCKLLSTVYYRGADCCALCYDLSRSSSLKNVLKWFEGIKQLDKMPMIILVGTKSDASIEVELSEIKEVETAIGAVQSFVCSAKTGDGYDEILFLIDTIACISAIHRIYYQKLKLFILFQLDVSDYAPPLSLILLHSKFLYIHHIRSCVPQQPDLYRQKLQD
ncbi:Rab1a [Hexamita inflata]|uniref:Rab1a n=1 Tax=Hexamita inflata TaxID=28002 RepID=A0ABP1HSH6_9EUKA